MKVTITEHMLKTEIAIVLDDMRTAAESQREYLIGELSALLWVQGGGDLLRPVAFQRAVATWDEMRKGVRP